MNSLTRTESLLGVNQERWSNGVVEWWSIGLKIKENVCSKISNGIREVLSFGFSRHSQWTLIPPTGRGLIN